MNRFLVSVTIILGIVLALYLGGVSKPAPPPPALPLPSPTKPASLQSPTTTLQPAPTPQRAETTLVPTSGLVGTTVTLKGTGFIASKAATITYDGNQVASTIVSADGTFSIIFIVPSSQPGQHTIAATDGTNMISKTFTALAPPPPVTVISRAEAVSIGEQVATTPTGKGILSVGLRYANGRPMVNRVVVVYTQKQDVSGNWVRDSQVTYGQTDNAGRVSFELTPGNYALIIVGLEDYNWGNMVNEIGQADVSVKAGYRTEVVVTLGRLTVELAYADGKPIVNRYVYVYTQKQDVAGNWVRDSQVIYGQPDNAGRVSFELTPGNYALIIVGLEGYNWGNMVGDVGEVNLAVRTGQTTVKRVDMGRLIVGITTPQGGAANGVYVYVHTQKQDVAGKWTRDTQVTYRQTDNSGMVSFDLTPGQYAIQFRRPGEKEDQYLYSITVEGGKITNIVK